MSVPRRRLAAQGAAGAAAYAWSRLRSRLGGTPSPAAGAFMIHRLDSFVTWHDRPKGAAAGSPVATFGGYPRTAIVVQGPVVAESGFTLAAVTSYRALFPDTDVIVSTWDDLPAATGHDLAATGAHIVTSARPADGGFGNLTLQLVSTQAGIAAARDLGAEYVLKTRSDQRLYAPQSVPFLHALLDAFPLGPDGGGQQRRLAVLDFITGMFVPYAFCDMLAFGTLDDVQAFWSAEPDHRPPAEVAALPRRTPREVVARRAVEIHLGRSYADRIGWSGDETLRDWWRLLAQRFVVVDAAMLDLLWVKYQMREYPHRGYESGSPFRTVQFADWLTWSMNPSMNGIDVPEHLLDAPL